MLVPLEGAKTYVNKKRLQRPSILASNSSLVFGHLNFRFIHPDEDPFQDDAGSSPVPNLVNLEGYMPAEGPLGENMLPVVYERAFYEQEYSIIDLDSMVAPYLPRSSKRSKHDREDSADQSRALEESTSGHDGEAHSPEHHHNHQHHHHHHHHDHEHHHHEHHHHHEKYYTLDLDKLFEPQGKERDLQRASLLMQSDTKDSGEAYKKWALDLEAAVLSVSESETSSLSSISTGEDVPSDDITSSSHKSPGDPSNVDHALAELEAALIKGPQNDHAVSSWKEWKEV